ncbi:rhodanese-like domain-containing protein [Actinosynnema sp. ALI-1.44]|uniref:rhodanese-like domain-containing protein n=1 Tax=Actinosynnema sp. ALI-1.44 TaxID=1933779 RepID=UPI0011774C7E|nr:rhodanese-like domain-containing protein [Actinosynnema sp. ALI-1.44]
MPNVPAVTVNEVPADVTLLDVREQDEWDAGHAPDALHLPMSELAGRLEELPNDQDVYVICRTGGRSARVVAYLNGNGWDATNIDGGMQSWQLAGKAMVSESQAEPQVI